MADPITREQRERLIMLHKQATPEPWRADLFSIRTAHGAEVDVARVIPTRHDSDANAVLIAAARNALPAYEAALQQTEEWLHIYKDEADALRRKLEVAEQVIALAAAIGTSREFTADKVKRRAQHYFADKVRALREIGEGSRADKADTKLKAARQAMRDALECLPPATDAAAILDRGLSESGEGSDV